MNTCIFCAELLKVIDDDAYYKKTHEYTVALIARYYYEGEVCGQLTYASKPLNFCPVCGKKLDLDQIKKEIQDRYHEKK